jgi:hypothetical protein
MGIVFRFVQDFIRERSEAPFMHHHVCPCVRASVRPSRNAFKAERRVVETWGLDHSTCLDEGMRPINFGDLGVKGHRDIMTLRSQPPRAK